MRGGGGAGTTGPRLGAWASLGCRDPTRAASLKPRGGAREFGAGWSGMATSMKYRCLLASGSNRVSGDAMIQCWVYHGSPADAFGPSRRGVGSSRACAAAPSRPAPESNPGRIGLGGMTSAVRAFYIMHTPATGPGRLGYTNTVPNADVSRRRRGQFPCPNRVSRRISYFPLMSGMHATFTSDLGKIWPGSFAGRSTSMYIVTQPRRGRHAPARDAGLGNQEPHMMRRLVGTVLSALAAAVGVGGGQG